jgi:hypothetical protein
MQKRKIGLNLFAMLFVALSLSLLLVGCEKPDTTLEDAKATFEITYAQGDSATSVTQNVTLPTTTSVEGLVVTWSSSNV